MIKYGDVSTLSPFVPRVRFALLFIFLLDLWVEVVGKKRFNHFAQTLPPFPLFVPRARFALRFVYLFRTGPFPPFPLPQRRFATPLMHFRNLRFDLLLNLCVEVVGQQV